MDGVPDLAGEVARRRLIRADDLAAMGIPLSSTPTAAGWYVAPALWSDLSDRIGAEVAEYQAQNPLEPGMPVDALRHRLDLPDRALIEALITPPLTMHGGRVLGRDKSEISGLVIAIDKAFDGLNPYTAPEANDLTAQGLGSRQLAAAVRIGLIIQLSPQVILRADAPAQAAKALSQLDQPFTLSQARQALGTTRRVAVPLLELLDKNGITHRHPDDRRTMI
jgi:selenocysteine-specific elongation factor